MAKIKKILFQVRSTWRNEADWLPYLQSVIKQTLDPKITQNYITVTTFQPNY